MLGKLLKYDLKSIFKFLVIFYSLALFFAVLTRVFLNIDHSVVLEIVGQFCSGVTVAMVFNILINNLIRLWVRFRNNLYKDESYLTHTLPVSKRDLYLSKMLTAILSTFVSIFVIGIVLFISYYSKGNIEFLKGMLLPIANMYGSTVLKVLIVLLFVFFLEFAHILQIGYTGIILGHKMNRNKLEFSVIFGFIAYMIMQVFTLLVVFIIALFNKDMLNLFITNSVVNMEMVKAILYITSGLYIVSLIIVYIVNISLFKKGVNVD